MDNFDRLRKLANIAQEKKIVEKKEIHYKKTAQDGKTYGVIKEGVKYYVVNVNGDDYAHIGNPAEVWKRGINEYRKATVFLDQKVKEINESIVYTKRKKLNESMRFGEEETIDEPTPEIDDSTVGSEEMDMGDSSSEEADIENDTPEEEQIDEPTPEEDVEEVPEIDGEQVDSEDTSDEDDQQQDDGESPQVVAGKIQHMLRKIAGEPSDISAAINQVIGAIGELARDTEYQDDTRDKLKKMSMELDMQKETATPLKDMKAVRKAKLESMNESDLAKLVEKHNILSGKHKNKKINRLLNKIKIVENKRQRLLLKK